MARNVNSKVLYQGSKMDTISPTTKTYNYADLSKLSFVADSNIIIMTSHICLSQQHKTSGLGLHLATEIQFLFVKYDVVTILPQ